MSPGTFLLLEIGIYWLKKYGINILWRPSHGMMDELSGQSSDTP